MLRAQETEYFASSAQGALNGMRACRFDASAHFYYDIIAEAERSARGELSTDTCIAGESAAQFLRR